MRPLRSRWLLLLLLLLLFLLLPALALQAEETLGPDPAPLEPRALEDFSEMFERPLFSNTRRPARFSDDSGQSLDETQLRETWRLAGIVLRNERQVALFSQRQGEAREELEVGMHLEDEWVVERIAEDHVLLLRNQTAVQMLLREPGASPASNLPPAVDAPADPQAAPAAPAESAPAPAPQNDNAEPKPKQG